MEIVTKPLTLGVVSRSDSHAKFTRVTVHESLAIIIKSYFMPIWSTSFDVNRDDFKTTNYLDVVAFLTFLLGILLKHAGGNLSCYHPLHTTAFTLHFDRFMHTFITSNLETATGVQILET